MPIITREHMVSIFKRAINNMKKRDVCFTYQHHDGRIGFLTKKDFANQMRLFQQKGIVCREAITRDFDNNTSLVGIEPAPLSDFGRLVASPCFVCER
jgi:hypothetical protein